MQISKINLNAGVNNDGFAAKNKTFCGNSADFKFDKSLYNEPGSNVYFCGLAKGVDAIENTCISMLRKVRTERCRKFDEYDIQEIINALRNADYKQSKTEILDSCLYWDKNRIGERPDKQTLKQVIKMVSDKSENERYAILEFADNEVENVYKPLEAFSNLPEQSQKKLVKILEKIYNIDFIPLINKENNVISDLYDLFRIPVYAQDDLSRLEGVKADSCKIDAINLIREEIKCYQKSDLSPSIKEKVLSIANDIYDYTLNNLL